MIARHWLAAVLAMALTQGARGQITPRELAVERSQTLATPEELEARIEWARERLARLKEVPVEEPKADPADRRVADRRQARAVAELRILEARLNGHAADVDDEVDAAESQVVARRAEVDAQAADLKLVEIDAAQRKKYEETIERTTGRRPNDPLDLLRRETAVVRAQAQLDAARARLAEAEARNRRLLRLRKRWSRVAARFAHGPMPNPAPASSPADPNAKP